MSTTAPDGGPPPMPAASAAPAPQVTASAAAPSPLWPARFWPRYVAWSLDAALGYLQKQGKGVAILLNAEAGLAGLEASFAPQTAAPVKATRNKPDVRTYGVGAQILRDLGVTHMQLLSKALRLPSMTGYGLEVVGYIDSAA